MFTKLTVSYRALIESIRSTIVHQFALAGNRRDSRIKLYFAIDLVIACLISFEFVSWWFFALNHSLTLHCPPLAAD